MKKSNQLKFDFDFKNLWESTKLSFIHPNEYAERIPLSGGYKNPIIFFLIVFGISSFIGLIISSIINRNVSQFFLGIAQIVETLPFALLSLFILTAIFHWIARAMEGEGGFEESTRANSYATLPFLLAAVPFVSYIVDILYIYVLIISFARAQKFTKTKSALAIIPIFIILLVLAFVANSIGLDKATG